MFRAVVGFQVNGIDADSVSEVEEILNSLIEQLATVKTDVVWDDVDWLITEEEVF